MQKHKLEEKHKLKREEQGGAVIHEQLGRAGRLEEKASLRRQAQTGAEGTNRPAVKSPEGCYSLAQRVSAG